MKMKRTHISLGLLWVLLLTFGAAANGWADYRIGVLAKRGAERAIAQWKPTADYLKEELSVPFILVPLSFDEVEPAVNTGHIDFLLVNSAMYATIQKKYSYKAVATMVNSRGNKALESFGGVILVRNDSSIRTLNQIRGQRFMVVKYSSFGGGQMAWRLLVESGVNPRTDCSAFLEGKTHDNVVMAVRNKLADVGTVRSDTLERMHQEGKIDMADFRIINRIEDDFPFVHSTRLYPEWPLAAAPHVDSDIAKKVTRSLEKMRASTPAAKSAKIVGWKKAANYQPVVDCLRVIEYGVFAKQ